MKNLLEFPERKTSSPDRDGKVEERLAVPASRTGRRRLVFAVLLLAFLILLLAAIVPRVQQEAALKAEAKAVKTSLPKVPVVPVRRASEVTNLVLPGNTRGYQETPIYPRTNGYVKSYLVEIGQLAKAGQLLS